MKKPKQADPVYAQGKLREVVRVLAVAPGKSVERVAEARGVLLAISEEDFPAALREEFVAILHEIDRRQKKSGGYGMKSKTASKIAARLLDLWHDLAAANRKT